MALPVEDMVKSLSAAAGTVFLNNSSNTICVSCINISPVVQLLAQKCNITFFSYGILSQKLKMSETTKDTEMEPCMTQKSKKKSEKIRS